MKNLWNQALTNEELQSKFKATMKEYLQTLDIDAVGEYLRELNCHYYYHEFVKRSIVCALETVSNIKFLSVHQGNEANIEAILKLLIGLNSQFCLPFRQIEFGLKKAEEYVNETLKVDVPKSPELLQIFKEGFSKITFVLNA